MKLTTFAVSAAQKLRINKAYDTVQALDLNGPIAISFFLANGLTECYIGKSENSVFIFTKPAYNTPGELQAVIETAK